MNHKRGLKQVKIGQALRSGNCRVLFLRPHANGARRRGVSPISRVTVAFAGFMTEENYVLCRIHMVAFGVMLSFEILSSRQRRGLRMVIFLPPQGIMKPLWTRAGWGGTLATALLFTWALPSFLGSSTSTAYAGEPFKDFPLAVACENSGTVRMFFLSRITEDGTATYIASGRIGGTVTLSGRAKAVASEGGGNCVGKTLQELRASGQALDVKP